MDQVLAAMDDFEIAINRRIFKKTALIQNVAFDQLILLYTGMPAKNKQLYLPGELETECLTMILIPHPGFVIVIESEPCVVYHGPRCINDVILN